jgi:hypothetical protein
MKSVILISMIAASLSASAQEPMDKKHTMDKKDFTILISRGIGVSFQKFDNLNSRIAGFPEYEALKNPMWTLSLGSMHVMKNFISQITGTVGSTMSGHRDKKSSTLRSLSGGFDIGYDVIPADKIMLYPLAGIGVDAYQAIFYKDVSSVPFDDVLESPAAQNNIRSVRFNNVFATYRFGLGFALKSPKGCGTIGLQGGYTGSFKSKSWKSNENQTLSGAPVDNLSRFNVSLILSGGMGMMGMGKH